MKYDRVSYWCNPLSMLAKSPLFYIFMQFWRTSCIQLLDELLLNDFAAPFVHPVDTIEYPVSEMLSYLFRLCIIQDIGDFSRSNGVTRLCVCPSVTFIFSAIITLN